MQSSVISCLVFICVVGAALGDAEAKVGAVGSATPFRCYVCNSEQNEACRESPKSNSFAVDCPLNATNHPAILCRKIHMYLDEGYTPENKMSVRVVRECGYTDDSYLHRSGNCYYRSNSATRTWACSCTGSECNTGSLPVASSVLLASAALALVARFAAAA